jgi:hypothetical protein
VARFGNAEAMIGTFRTSLEQQMDTFCDYRLQNAYLFGSNAGNETVFAN